MKITLAVLFLGCFLALTDAHAIRSRKLAPHEAFFHARFMTLIVKRLDGLQKCNGCSELEKRCMEKAIVHDMIFSTKVMAGDMGIQPRELVNEMNLPISLSVTVVFIEDDDSEGFASHLRKTGQMNSVVQSMMNVVDHHARASGVQLGAVMGSTEKLLGLGGVVTGVLKNLPGLATGILGSAAATIAGLAGGAFGGAAQAAGGLAGGAANLAGGVAGGAANLAGGVAGGALNLAGGLAGGAGNLAGGLTKTAAGVAGGLANAATGVAGGLANAATGAVGGIANAATGIVGGLAKTATGLLGGLTKGGGLLG